MSGGAHAPMGVALVGAGEFGQTFLSQARRIPGLAVRVVCDQDTGRARAALTRAGYDEAQVAHADSRPAVLGAIERACVAVVASAELLRDLPLDAVLEATGSPDGAAAVAELALACGYHSAMVTKEAEVVVGPELAARARRSGRAHAVVDGDQPSLLIGLIARARRLGLPVVAAGKSTESDYVLDPARGTVTAWGRTVAAPGHAGLFRLDGDLVGRLAERALPELATSTVPDLCEMGIVANHTDLAPDRAELHAPVARTVELPDIFRLREHGGVLARSGVVDVFTCLRRPDEISFAGGVFIVVEAPEVATGRLLASKGIPGSTCGRYLLLHNPVHLLGAEAPATLLDLPALAARPVEGEGVRPRYDLAARATQSLPAGSTLELGARHAVAGLEPLLLPARPAEGDNPVPYYLAAGARLARPVSAGAVLTCADVILDAARPLVRLRRSQDRNFF